MSMMLARAKQIERRCVMECVHRNRESDVPDRLGEIVAKERFKNVTSPLKSSTQSLLLYQHPAIQDLENKNVMDLQPLRR